ncbi:MAG: histidinol phosphate phosphatase domain-containing protein [Deltaproteobacteria bacterium]|nr:histidinol phosphate phosphatase domain-containing protein [Deltaproteobacteria bacterium]
MIDLHTHTIFSDGVLVPAELARRARVAGYRALAFTDHVDFSNLDFVLPRLITACRVLTEAMDMVLLPGVELTHVPPSLIRRGVEQARALGAAVVVVHGETLVEPVAPGTNLAALEAGADILAHPGLLSLKEAELAAAKGVFLELTTRGGHSLANGHVAALARQTGAKLLLNNDAHGPGDLVSLEMAERIALGAGLTDDEWRGLRLDAVGFVRRKSPGWGDVDGQ